MWITYIVFFLAVLALIAGVFAGGVFTIVFIPVAVILVVVGGAALMLGGGSARDGVAPPHPAGATQGVGEAVRKTRRRQARKARSRGATS